MSEHQPTTSTRRWMTRNIRLTAFPSDPAVTQGREWWKELTGEEPPESTRKLGTRREEGSYEGFGTVVVVDPTRVSLQLNYYFDAEEAEELPEHGPHVGSPEEALAKCLPLCQRFVQMLPSTRRLGLGLILDQPVENRDDGLDVLASLLPSVRIDHGMRDFLYRVNRPRRLKEGIEGLELNRLSTWTVYYLESTLKTENERVKLSASSGWFTNLSLDVNTSQTPDDDLPLDRLSDILHELVELSLEIARDGDIA